MRLLFSFFLLSFPFCNEAQSMKKYILLAAIYEYTKVKKERKKKKNKTINAASHVIPRNEASAPLHYPPPSDKAPAPRRVYMWPAKRCSLASIPSFQHWGYY